MLDNYPNLCFWDILICGNLYGIVFAVVGIGMGFANGGILGNSA